MTYFSPHRPCIETNFQYRLLHVLDLACDTFGGFEIGVALSRASMSRVRLSLKCNPLLPVGFWILGRNARFVSSTFSG